MDDRTLKTLEIEALVKLVAGHVQTPLGRRRALDLLPCADLDRINRDLDITSEAVRYFAAGGAFGLGDVTDPESELSQLHIEGTLLDPHQILALQTLVSAGMGLRSEFGDQELKALYPHIASIAASMPDL